MRSEFWEVILRWKRQWQDLVAKRGSGGWRLSQEAGDCGSFKGFNLPGSRWEFNVFLCFYSTSWYISLIILLVLKLFSEHFTHTGFGGMVEGAGIFPEWEEWIGERGYCAEKWGPVVADGVNIERKVLVRIVQCWILESSSYFWSAGSLSGLQEAYTSLHGWDLLVIVGRGENCYKVNFGQSSFGPIWVFSEDGAFWSVSVLFRCLSIAYGGVKVWGVPSSFGCWGLEQGWGFGLLVIGRRRFCYFQQCNWGQICSNIWVEDIRQ